MVPGCGAAGAVPGDVADYGLHGQPDGAVFQGLPLPAAGGDAARVPSAGLDVRGAAGGQCAVDLEEERGEQGAVALFRRSAAYDGDGDVHHQRCGAGGGVAAGALAGGVFRGEHGSGDGSDAVYGEADSESGGVAGVRDEQPGHSDGEGGSEAEDRGDDAAACAGQRGVGGV